MENKDTEEKEEKPKTLELLELEKQVLASYLIGSAFSGSEERQEIAIRINSSKTGLAHSKKYIDNLFQRKTTEEEFLLYLEQCIAKLISVSMNFSLLSYFCKSDSIEQIERDSISEAMQKFIDNLDFIPHSRTITIPETNIGH
jgi:hypothetical protein